MIEAPYTLVAAPKPQLKRYEEMPIRPAQPDDHREWLRMRKSLWPKCSDDMHAFEMKLFVTRSETHKVFVYERQGGQLGGFAEVSIRERVDGSFSKHVGYMDGWYVDPDLRAKGIGRDLLAAAESWVSDKGYSQIASDCGTSDRESIKIHKALGFEETFRLVHFLKRIE